MTPRAIGRVAEILMEQVSTVPSSKEKESRSPRHRAKRLGVQAAAKAALISGGLSLPPGPLGMITILPELGAIWNVQRQLVSDIASVYGKQDALGREAMIYCLFKHAASQLVRDLVVRVGERLVVRTATERLIQRCLRRIGVVITERVAGRTLARWVPIVGAVGVGTYAYYDTAQVARTAIELFERQTVVDTGSGVPVSTVDDPRGGVSEGGK